MAWGDNDPVASAPAASWGADDAAAPPDKYKQAALERQQKLKAIGWDDNGGYSGRIVRGMTLGAAGDLVSALSAPLEMLEHGTINPIEGYKYAKASDELRKKDAEEKTGMLGSALELGGGLASGVGLAKNGLTFLKSGMSLPQTILAGAKEGAAYGGATGFFGGGDNLADKAKGAATGAALGAGLGGATPIVGSALSNIAAPVVSNIRARINPEAFAQSKFAEALANSGKSASQIDADIANAAASGQGEYRVADAMGNAGQRALSTVTRAPGPGRQEAVDFLERRQGDQGRRIAAFLREGFDAPQTAQQTEQALAAQRATRANTNYAPVRTDPTAIDVSDAVSAANRSISPLADRAALAQGSVPTDLAARLPTEAGESVIRDPIREAVREARSYLAAPTLTVSNVEKAFRAKTNIDQMIAHATEQGQGGKVAELIPVRDALDATLARTSRQYAGARDAYRADSNVVDAVGAGKQAGQGGLAEDNIRTFTHLGNEAERSAFRAGYADPLVSSAQNTSRGTNKAMPLRTLATEAEFPRFAAPGRADELVRRIDRENTMFETRRQAIGGSQTADNLADEAASKIDPSFVAALIGGHYASAARQAMHGAANAAKGLTPDVRAELGRLLLSGNGTAQGAMNSSLAQRAKVQAIANALKSGALAGGDEAINTRR